VPPAPAPVPPAPTLEPLPFAAVPLLPPTDDVPAGPLLPFAFPELTLTPLPPTVPVLALGPALPLLLPGLDTPGPPSAPPVAEPLPVDWPAPAPVPEPFWAMLFPPMLLVDEAPPVPVVPDDPLLFWADVLAEAP
jgi:hypothetical protein